MPFVKTNIIVEGSCFVCERKEETWQAVAAEVAFDTETLLLA